MTSTGGLTETNLAENNRQLDRVHFHKETGTQKATRLSTAAKKLGIDASDIFKDRLEEMEGALPMERF